MSNNSEGDDSINQNSQTTSVMINDPTVLFLNVGYNNIPIPPQPLQPFSFCLKTYNSMFGLGNKNIAKNNINTVTATADISNTTNTKTESSSISSSINKTSLNDINTPSSFNDSTHLHPETITQFGGPTPQLLYWFPSKPSTSDIFTPGYCDTELDLELQQLKLEYNDIHNIHDHDIYNNNNIMKNNNYPTLDVGNKYNKLPLGLQQECQELLLRYAEQAEHEQAANNVEQNTPNFFSTDSSSSKSKRLNYNPNTCPFRAKPTLYQLSHVFSPPQLLVLEATQRQLQSKNTEETKQILSKFNIINDPSVSSPLEYLITPIIPPQRGFLSKIKAYLAQAANLLPYGFTRYDLLGGYHDAVSQNLPSQTNINNEYPIQFKTNLSQNKQSDVTYEMSSLIGHACSRHLSQSIGAFFNTPFVNPIYTTQNCGYNSYTANVFNLFNGLKGFVQQELNDDISLSELGLSSMSSKSKLFPIQDITIPNINLHSMLFPELHSLWFNQPNSYTLLHVFPSLGWKDSDTFTENVTLSDSLSPSTQIVTNSPSSLQTLQLSQNQSLSSSSSSSFYIPATPLPRSLPHNSQPNQVLMPLTPCRAYFPQSSHINVFPPRSALHLFGQMWSNLALIAPQPYHVEQLQGYTAHGQLHALPFTQCPLDITPPNIAHNVPLWVQFFTKAQFFRRLQCGSLAHELINAKYNHDHVTQSTLQQYQKEQNKPISTRTTALKWFEQPLPCDQQCSSLFDNNNNNNNSNNLENINNHNDDIDNNNSICSANSTCVSPQLSTISVVVPQFTKPHVVPPYFVPYSSFIQSFTDFHTLLPLTDLPSIEVLHAFSASRLFEYDTIPFEIRHLVRDTPITDQNTLNLCKQSVDYDRTINDVGHNDNNCLISNNSNKQNSKHLLASCFEDNNQFLM